MYPWIVCRFLRLLLHVVHAVRLVVLAGRVDLGALLLSAPAAQSALQVPLLGSHQGATLRLAVLHQPSRRSLDFRESTLSMLSRALTARAYESTWTCHVPRAQGSVCCDHMAWAMFPGCTMCQMYREMVATGALKERGCFSGFCKCSCDREWACWAGARKLPAKQSIEQTAGPAIGMLYKLHNPLLSCGLVVRWWMSTILYMISDSMLFLATYEWYSTYAYKFNARNSHKALFVYSSLFTVQYSTLTCAFAHITKPGHTKYLLQQRKNNTMVNI